MSSRQLAGELEVLDRLPMSLKGRYPKYLLYSRIQQTTYLFKVYSPDDELVRLAEAGASRIYLDIDPACSLLVRNFCFNGMNGTIQPFLDGYTSFPVEGLLKRREILVTVLKRQVLDWVMSNHDTHVAHVLISPMGTIKFVDYGQCFKYFGRDQLDTRYHPNLTVGQDEPIYNLIYRKLSSRTVRQLSPEIAHYARAVEQTAHQNLWGHHLRHYSAARIKRGVPPVDLEAEIRGRVRSASQEFDMFFTRMLGADRWAEN